MFKVIEKFISIDGEGPTAGELAVFIRFWGCNLRCTWCDTKYSFEGNENFEVLNAMEIYNYIKQNQCKNVTLTGGEPLLQKDIKELLSILSEDESLLIHIETNGSINISDFKKEHKNRNISYVVDFKLPMSEMTEKMCCENFLYVGDKDVYKFVIASKTDLELAYEIVVKYALTSKCLVYFSPVVDYIDPKHIVDFMKDKKLNNVRLQLQLHKIIWSKDARGV